MTPEQFVAKWRVSTRSERAASQEQFIDLCHMLDEPTPGDDPTGERFAFEKGADKSTGRSGWADIWKAEHFAWENKGKGKDLNAAFAQLQQYAGALGNPPLLVVSDMQRFRIHTAWTNTVSKIYDFTLDDLLVPKVRDIFKAVLSDPEKLRPGLTRQALTEQAAEKFAALARRLRDRGHEPQRVAHFVNRLVFCMFAEDVDLLPSKMFQRMLAACEHKPERFEGMAGTLFTAMRSGGLVGFEQVEWFNGGLFDSDEALPLDKEDVKSVLATARLDWAEIDPSIFGTLFERGLDPGKRSQLGAHYTDRDKIMLIVEPVVIRPLAAEWDAVKAEMRALLDKSAAAKLPAARAKGHADAETLYRGFLDRLTAFRVLDPACGSGNFLYLALLALKDLEHRSGVEAEAMGLQREFPRIGPECVSGIDINPYAAELARISVWIGEIQWMRRNGYGVRRNPILRPLDTIECRDALLNPDGSEAMWPAADVVIGNPPFLGAKLMKRTLGIDATEAIRALYKGRLPGFTDLVCYWFENGRKLIEAGKVTRVGLVATNSIRKNTNLPVLQRIAATTRIFEAWSEEKWTVDGATVDVSLLCFGNNGGGAPRLNGEAVTGINPDLTSGLNLTLAKPLPENRNGAFLGIQKSGPFDVPGALARAWMLEPNNPNGRGNKEVLKPYWNGDDLTGRPRDTWFIDLPLRSSEAEAALFVSPFRHLATTPDEDGKLVHDLRGALDERAGVTWWEPWRPRPEMRSRIERLSRYIVTAETAEHRLFAWLAYPVLPDKNLIVIPREDDLTFGLLQSRFHEAWALRKGSDLQDRPRYTHTTTFATFPFPEGMTPDRPTASAHTLPAASAIETAAWQLDLRRRSWLNPADLVETVPEVVPGFPDRILPRNERAAALLAKRTLTNLYNERPQWLAMAHAELDAAVAAAYGWPADISEDEALARLLDLNHARASGGAQDSAGSKASI